MVASIFSQQQSAAPPAETYYLELEDGSGSLLLETGDHLLLEDAP